MPKFFPEGFPCHYCKRPMDRSNPDLYPTREHLSTKEEGGKGRNRKVVWACMTCNNMRGGMLHWQWRLYMSHNPEWYLNTSGPRGVALWAQFILGKPLSEDDDLL